MKRSFKSLLAAVAILAVMCSGAWAIGPTYISDDSSNPGPTWTTENSPYIVDSDARILSRITVSGDVTLILNDGCTLKADVGINVEGGHSLTITTPDAPDGTGRLEAIGYIDNAAIGGNKGRSCGKITILGGIIRADSKASGGGIGIGKDGAGGEIFINGGIVTARSALGKGIGGKLSSSADGNAWIDTDSLADMSGSFSGAIFIYDRGKVYGSATVRGYVMMSVGDTLEIPAGATLTIKQGATFSNNGTIENDGIIDSEGTVTGIGTVNNNGAYFHDGGGEVAGDVTLTDDRTITGTLTIKDGAQLTVAPGATLDASKGTIDNKGKVENDGIVKLPETMKPEEIKALGMTGTGTVELGGKTYDNEGTEQAGEPEHGADAPTIHDYVESAGLKVHGNKLTHESALAAINGGGGMLLNGGAVATDETISTLAIQSVDVVPGGYAALIFDKLLGSYLVSGDRTLGVEELNIIKVISADAAQLLVPTDGAAGKSAEELDGTFVISRDGRIVSTVNGASDDYSLVVCISDDGRLDLARTVPGHVVDPLVLVKSTGGEDSGSSGACAAGSGLAAIVALAMIKRRKR